MKKWHRKTRVSDFCRAKTDVRRNKEDKRTDIPPTAPTSSSLSLVLAPGMSKGKGRSDQSQLDTMVFSEPSLGEAEKLYGCPFFHEIKAIYGRTLIMSNKRDKQRKISLLRSLFARAWNGNFALGTTWNLYPWKKKLKLYNEYNSNDSSLWN